MKEILGENSVSSRVKSENLRQTSVIWRQSSVFPSQNSVGKDARIWKLVFELKSTFSFLLSTKERLFAASFAMFVRQDEVVEEGRGGQDGNGTNQEATNEY